MIRYQVPTSLISISPAHQVLGNVLALDEEAQQHLLRHEELRSARGEATTGPIHGGPQKMDGL